MLRIINTIAVKTEDLPPKSEMDLEDYYIIPKSAVKTVCIAMWNLNDMAMVAGDYFHDEEFEDEEFHTMLETMERHHDADLGITWETLRHTLEEHIRGRNVST